MPNTPDSRKIISLAALSEFKTLLIQDFNGRYVPYLGADASVNLGANNFITSSYFEARSVSNDVINAYTRYRAGSVVVEDASAQNTKIINFPEAQYLNNSNTFATQEWANGQFLSLANGGTMSGSTPIYFNDVYHSIRYVAQNSSHGAGLQLEGANIFLQTTTGDIVLTPGTNRKLYYGSVTANDEIVRKGDISGGYFPLTGGTITGNVIVQSDVSRSLSVKGGTSQQGDGEVVIKTAMIGGGAEGIVEVTDRQDNTTQYRANGVYPNGSSYCLIFPSLSNADDTFATQGWVQSQGYTTLTLVSSGGNNGSATTAARSDHTHAAATAATFDDSNSTWSGGSNGFLTAEEKGYLSYWRDGEFYNYNQTKLIAYNVSMSIGYNAASHQSYTSVIRFPHITADQDVTLATQEWVGSQGYTTNTGTVTSVAIGVGTGLAIDDASAITTSGTRTISIASGYKLPTTSEWSAKANSSDLGTAAFVNTGTSQGNVPVLGAGGKLSNSVLPSIAITETFVCSSQAAMLALDAQTGDVCVRTDLSKTFILQGREPGTLSDWVELATPTTGIVSVNGDTGPIVTFNYLASASKSGQTLTITNNGGGTVSLENTWRPLGTGANDAAAGNHDHDSVYLKLAGGTLSNVTYPQLIIQNPNGGQSGIQFLRGGNTGWEMYINGGNFYLYERNTNQIAFQLNESSQYSGSYDRPLVYGNKLAYLSDIPSTLPASDVYSWAKQSTKPSYNFNEIGGRYESYLTWGGGQSHVGGFGPLDAALVSRLSANRVAGISGEAIEIERSNDGGSTWTTVDRNTISNSARKAFFTTGNWIELKYGSVNQTTDRLRITMNATDYGVYTQIYKLMMLVSTSGSTGCTVYIETAFYSSPTVWHEVGTFDLSGWSGWNVLNFTLPGSGALGGNNYNEHNKFIRFTFACTGTNETYTDGLAINCMYLFGGVGWSTPSTLAANGVPYNYDEDGNMTVPASIYASALFDSNSRVITAATIGSQSVNYATSSGNADTVDGYHAADLVNYGGNQTGIGSGSPFSGATSWFDSYGNVNALIYNTNGVEYSMLGSQSPSRSYGSILRWGYNDTYLYIARKSGGSWQSQDWEKISAGYADSAGTSGYVIPFSSSPDNAYVGGRLSSFYSWNQGGPVNSYSIGITVGGNPSDPYYGWQIAQSLWDNDLYYRRRDQSTGSFTSWLKVLNPTNGLSREPWWNDSDSHSANDLGSGITFAYSSHGAPTTGTLVSFAGIGGTCESYRLQIQGGYYDNSFRFRNRNGDNGTWGDWREVIHSGNIGSQSVSYAASAGNANTLDNYDSSYFYPASNPNGYTTLTLVSSGGNNGTASTAARSDHRHANAVAHDLENGIEGSDGFLSASDKTFIDSLSNGSFSLGVHTFNFSSVPGTIAFTTIPPHGGPVHHLLSLPTSGSTLTTQEWVQNQGYTTNTGTVTSVAIGVGTGLAIDDASAITTSGTRTISIASDYKLPTTTEWNSKSSVSGTNDGTNWTSITIDGTTKAIPSGGGSTVYHHLLHLRINYQVFAYEFYSTSNASTTLATLVSKLNLNPSAILASEYVTGDAIHIQTASFQKSSGTVSIDAGDWYSKNGSNYMVRSSAAGYAITIDLEYITEA